MDLLNEVRKDEKRFEYDHGHRILNIGERVGIQARNYTDRNI